MEMKVAKIRMIRILDHQHVKDFKEAKHEKNDNDSIHNKEDQDDKDKRDIKVANDKDVTKITCSACWADQMEGPVEGIVKCIGVTQLTSTVCFSPARLATATDQISLVLG